MPPQQLPLYGCPVTKINPADDDAVPIGVTSQCSQAHVTGDVYNQTIDSGQNLGSIQTW